METNEQFKPLPLDNRVMVGNMGTIIRACGKRVTGSPHNLGYRQLGLTINGKAKVYKVHRLVALTWVDNPHNKPEVNHINGNKADNRATNLEWVTKSENHKHAWATGLQDTERLKARKGFKHSPETREKMRQAKLGKHRDGFGGKWL